MISEWRLECHRECHERIYAKELHSVEFIKLGTLGTLGVGQATGLDVKALTFLNFLN